jgi:hypothetical protein
MSATRQSFRLPDLAKVTATLVTKMITSQQNASEFRSMSLITFSNVDGFGTEVTPSVGTLPRTFQQQIFLVSNIPGLLFDQAAK